MVFLYLSFVTFFITNLNALPLFLASYLHHDNAMMQDDNHNRQLWYFFIYVDFFFFTN